MTGSAALAAQALKQIAVVLDQLTEQQLTDLAEGRAQIEVRSGDVVLGSASVRPPRKAAVRAAAKSTVDIGEVVQAVKEMPDREAVIAYLTSRDKELTVAVLKEVAAALGPTVIATGSNKAVLRRNIADGSAGFRSDATSVFGGGWGR